MHSIKIHKKISLMISFFYLIGLWHRGATPSAREFGAKLFYCIYYCIFVISFIGGAIANVRDDTTIFLTELSIAVVVYALKLWILIWKQNEILGFLNRICEFSIPDDCSYVLLKDKLERFMKCVMVFVVGLIVGSSLEAIVFPVFGSERTLFFEIWFPLDWRNSDVAFWLATVFIFIGDFLLMSAIIFSIFIWYLLLNCSLRYEVLGNQLRNLGRNANDGNLTKDQMQKHFFENLKRLIDAHIHLKGLTDKLGCFFADLFFIQFGTSGVCICGSIYCLALNVGDNLLERLMYLLLFFLFIIELFMITYFGNEIMFSCDRLSYSLFESDWYNQPQLTKRCIIIFGEYLKQPQEFVIGKLYPLTLETFTRILNSSYSMFNVLKNFKE